MSTKNKGGKNAKTTTPAPVAAEVVGTETTEVVNETVEQPAVNAEVAAEVTETTATADGKVEAPKAEKKAKEVKEKKVKVLSEKQKVKFAVATPVYSRKDGRDKPSMMRAESEVIVQELVDAGPTGTNLVAVKKENSKRIFYTPIENLTSQGIEFKPIEAKAEVAVIVGEEIANAPADAIPGAGSVTTDTKETLTVETHVTETSVKETTVTATHMTESHTEETLGEQEVAALIPNNVEEEVGHFEEV